MNLMIGGIKEASTVDYPGEIVSVIFFCQCPFRCPFCHNWSLVLAQSEECHNASVKDIIEQVSKFRKFITGLCITGGEPTVQIDGLIELLKESQKIKLLNKLDTNGFFPDRLARLFTAGLVDYVALDIKAPFNPEIYGKMIGKPSIGEEAVKKVSDTLHLLKKFKMPFEARTTIIPNFFNSEKEIEQIAQKLEEFDVPRYILQQFRASGGTLDEAFAKLPATNHEVLIKLAKSAQKYISDVRIRSIETGEKKI
ncbi:MAG TPA: anaerobic ribonucleoside-triphosphate reductase activating protein [Candidatus Deferrimicrobium sp.]|nr:anaerobic ribonucleoside-triphosphate reductase activating protein [Candidatus Deferrimicrobium sp.]